MTHLLQGHTSQHFPHSSSIWGPDIQIYESILIPATHQVFTLSLISWWPCPIPLAVLRLECKRNQASTLNNDLIVSHKNKYKLISFAPTILLFLCDQTVYGVEYKLLFEKGMSLKIHVGSKWVTAGVISISIANIFARIILVGKKLLFILKWLGESLPVPTWLHYHFPHFVSTEIVSKCCHLSLARTNFQGKKLLFSEDHWPKERIKMLPCSLRFSLLWQILNKI